MIKTKHKIIIGDSRCMNGLNDESVHLIITSPPYWQLKDYGVSHQIGFDDSYEEYINNLNLVWNECYRVLHKGCRLCVNIGDQFARSVYYGRYKVIPIRTEIIKFCESIGFDYMGAIIWQKVTTTNTTGGASVMGSFPYPRNGILKIDYEFILIFKKLGTAPKVDFEKKKLSKLSTEEWNNYFSGHWNFGGERQDNHIAMFPEELPKRLIKMFSFVGDTVLDPFLGSGTVSLVAKKLQRNSVGYEINPEFVPIIKEKMQVDKSDIFENASYDFVEQGPTNIDFSESVNNLPYIFKDPHSFNKKIDPKKIRFGSKVDNSSNQERTDYFTVKDVLEPNLVKLNNGLFIKLIGINIKSSRKNDAINYLIEKTKGHKVFIKYDNQKYDNNNNLLGYLYLKNKTFINAHLIKEGLVNVEKEGDYKYKDKFIKLGIDNGKRMDS